MSISTASASTVPTSSASTAPAPVSQSPKIPTSTTPPSTITITPRTPPSTTPKALPGINMAGPPLRRYLREPTSTRCLVLSPALSRGPGATLSRGQGAALSQGQGAALSRGPGATLSREPDSKPDSTVQASESGRKGKGKRSLRQAAQSDVPLPRPRAFATREERARLTPRREEAAAEAFVQLFGERPAVSPPLDDDQATKVNSEIAFLEAQEPEIDPSVDQRHWYVIAREHAALEGRIMTNNLLRAGENAYTELLGRLPTEAQSVEAWLHDTHGAGDAEVRRARYQVLDDEELQGVDSEGTVD